MAYAQKQQRLTTTTMNAQEKDRTLAQRIHANVGTMEDASAWAERYNFIADHARTLRRAQLTLHRWAEEECNGTVQRIESKDPDIDGKPMRWVIPNYRAPFSIGPIPDREAGALRRVEQVCKTAGLHYYHQTDPRGCALYVSAEPLTDQNYSIRGIPCI